MRVVIDTNVLVSALLHPLRVPDLALRAAREHAVVLIDPRIDDEYRRVLARPKFARIDPSVRDALVSSLVARAEVVAVEGNDEGPLVDPDDRAFVEVALAGRADAVITGNARDFPLGLGFDVWSPAELLRRLNR